MSEKCKCCTVKVISKQGIHGKRGHQGPPGAPGATYAPAYKVYTALLTQIGTGAPTAAVLENTLGVTPTFSYVGTGRYTIDSIGTFIVDKTTASIPNSEGTHSFVNANLSNDYIQIYTFDTNAPIAPRDGGLYKTPIEIKVYL